MDTGREEYLLNKRFMRAMEVLMLVLPFAVGGTVQCSEFLLSFRLQVGQSELQITLKPLCVFTQQCTDTELCSITNEQTPSVRVSRISEPCNKLLMCHSK